MRSNDRRDRFLRLLGLDQPHRPLRLERARERGVLVCKRDLTAERCEPVPEAAVDRLFGRPQRCQRLTSLVCIVELRAHQRTQGATPPVRRQHADDADPCGPQLASRHRQAECERSCATDDRSVRPRPMHPLERQEARETLHALLVRDHAEVLADRKDGACELVEVLDSPDLECRQKSSGQ
jgi:hypothetical protein